MATATPQKPSSYINSNLYKLAESPYPVWGLSALCAAGVPAAAKMSPAMPHFGFLMGFSAIFAGAGYIKHAGDAENGSGTTTAWCLMYMFLNMRRTIREPRPLPALLMTGVLANLAISGRKTLQVEFGI